MCSAYVKSKSLYQNRQESSPAATTPDTRFAARSLADAAHGAGPWSFAARAVACVRALGLDPTRVNRSGGAISLGHPLGCTGAKLTATLLHELRRRRERYGVVSMCVGGGMGAAALFENMETRS